MTYRTDHKTAISIILLVAITLLLYWRVLSFEYVWDDYTIFLNRSKLIGESLGWQALSERVLFESSYFRPLIFLTLWIEFKLVGQNPMVSHGVNLFLFITNILLLFFLGKKLSVLSGQRSPVLIAFIAALIYTVHPALVETTAWVSGRFDIMATMFILAGALIYLSEIPQRTKIVFLSFCMLMSLASKEIGVVFPIVLFCLWMAAKGAQSSERTLRVLRRGVVENKIFLLASVVVFVFYWVLRVQSMPDTFGGDFNLNYIVKVWFKEALPVDTLRFYLAQAFIPFRDIAIQHPQDYFLSSWGNFRILGNILVLIFLLLLFVIAWAKRSMSSWLFLAGLICLLPVLHIFPLAIDTNIGHERFLTAPLAFWVLAVALIRYDLIFRDFYGKREASASYLDKRKAWTRLSAWVLFFWIIFAFITTYSVIPMWKNNLLLWGWTKQLYPNLIGARYNYLIYAGIGGHADIVKEEITKIEKELESGGTDIRLLPLYIEYLLKEDNPKVLSYTKILEERIPQYHNILNSSKEIKFFDKSPLPPPAISLVYDDISMATLMYKGDAEKALKNNEIAYWYADKWGVGLLNNRMIILYALGRFEEAENAKKISKNLYYYHSREEKEKRVSHSLARYCITIDMGGSCGELLAKKIISQEEVSYLKMRSIKMEAEKQMDKFGLKSSGGIR